jgi:hypothetical protein
MKLVGEGYANVVIYNLSQLRINFRLPQPSPTKYTCCPNTSTKMSQCRCIHQQEKPIPFRSIPFGSGHGRIKQSSSKPLAICQFKRSLKMSVVSGYTCYPDEGAYGEGGPRMSSCACSPAPEVLTNNWTVESCPFLAA